MKNMKRNSSNELNPHLLYVVNECYEACKREVDYQCNAFGPDLVDSIEATAEFNSGVVIVTLRLHGADKVEVIHDENEHNSDNIIYNVLHAMPDLGELIEQWKADNNYCYDEWSEEQFRLDIMNDRPFVDRRYCV